MLIGGPWYYIENNTYWYIQHLQHVGVLPKDVWPWDRNDRSQEYAQALTNLKTGCVYGALTEDALPLLPQMPRKPDASDYWVYDRKEADHRYKQWVYACHALAKATLTTWLEPRLPRLMELFEADMIEWFGPDIVETPAAT